MEDIPIREGKIPFDVPSVDSPCFTFFKVIGELSGETPPVIVVHGGPGAGHDYLLTFAALWPRYGIPVIFYDQIGCGQSTHLDSKAESKSFWQVSLFIAELDNLIDHFQLRNGPGFDLLGQSWGGMIGADFAGRRPQGLRKLILASALASMDLNIRGIQLLREQLPGELQASLKEAEESGDFDTPAYKEVQPVFFKKHVCRADDFPPELAGSFKNLSSAMAVYRTMYGPSSLSINGSLLGWTSIPGLADITAPTLVYNGEYDTSHDIATVPFFEHIPRVRWITFPDAGHMCHLEGGLRERVLELVGRFLTQQSSTQA